MIGGQKALQLVVLNSCDGARTKLDDPFAGIATILVQQGNSAVIAMQFEITDNAAKAFAEELYYCLIDRRYPIDAAVAEARKAMMDINQIEFATPVLFLRPGTADLFHFADPPDPALPPSSLPARGSVRRWRRPPSPPGGRLRVETRRVPTEAATLADRRGRSGRRVIAVSPSWRHCHRGRRRWDHGDPARHQRGRCDGARRQAGDATVPVAERPRRR